jgi:hypothetical protein
MNIKNLAGERHLDQEATTILLLRLALRLLGEARQQGNFGSEADLSRRALALVEELTGSTLSSDPPGTAVEVRLLSADSISLYAPVGGGSAIYWNLMLDGTLDGGTVVSVRAVPVDCDQWNSKERADLGRREVTQPDRLARRGQFTATTFLRALAGPPQPGAKVRLVAIMLYDDGFYVDYTIETEPIRRSISEMRAQELLALHQALEPVVTVTDDLGIEYFESGGEGGIGSGYGAFFLSLGFAPRPPSSAHILRVSADNATVEFRLFPEAGSDLGPSESPDLN